MTINNGPKEEDNTSVIGEENKDNKEKDSSQTIEGELDENGNPIKSEDNDNKKGEEGEEDILPQDPYEKLLADLKDENRRKGTALVEKNEKIKKLREELEEKGIEKEEIGEIINEVLSSKLGEIDEKSKKLDDALKITHENNIDTALSKVADNDGEKKVIRHFFDNKVNKSLSFYEQIEQAKILAKNAMSNEQFQKEVDEAGKMAIRTSGKIRSETGLTEDRQNLANALFKTKKGKEKFAKIINKQ